MVAVAVMAQFMGQHMAETFLRLQCPGRQVDGGPEQAEETGGDDGVGDVDRQGRPLHRNRPPRRPQLPPEPEVHRQQPNGDHHGSGSPHLIGNLMPGQGRFRLCCRVHDHGHIRGRWGVRLERLADSRQLHRLKMGSGGLRGFRFGNHRRLGSFPVLGQGFRAVQNAERGGQQRHRQDQPQRHQQPKPIL